MIPFVSGVAVVCAALMGVSLWLEPSLRWYASGDIAVLMARSILAPAIAAWIVAELIDLFRPLRLFDRRIRRVASRIVAGLTAGVFGAVGAAAALALADGWVHETVILTCAGALGAAATLALVRRVRRGECIRCRYDQRDQPAPGRPGWGICPECGTPVMAAMRARIARAA